MLVSEVGIVDGGLVGVSLTATSVVLFPVGIPATSEGPRLFEVGLTMEDAFVPPAVDPGDG